MIRALKFSSCRSVRLKVSCLTTPSMEVYTSCTMYCMLSTVATAARVMLQLGSGIRQEDRLLGCGVHSVQQKSSGLIFGTSRSGSDVTYSCHHNLSRVTYPIFLHSWRFSGFHSLQLITPRIY
jgi:hypothetical protein